MRNFESEALNLNRSIGDDYAVISFPLGSTSKYQPFRMIATSLSEFCKNPENEPILDYAPNSEERIDVDKSISKFYKTTADIPIVIGDEEIRTKQKRHQVLPSEYSHALAEFSHASEDIVKNAIESCLRVRKQWELRPLEERAEILFRAGHLVATKYRADLNAATMLGQAKTYIQAEIDAACELADFFRFNACFALKLADSYQPISPKGIKNTMTYRGLEGFVAAISPFNFTAIGGNLCAAPALMGNVVVWKPSDTSILANYITYKVLREAGVPAGVINFVPSDGPVFGDTITGHPDLSAVNFTGSVPTFRRIWAQVGSNINSYRGFPRLVGECGGKNFHFIHKSADVDTVVACSLRAAFEYQGQKCSALSRMYVPQSLWPQIKSKLLDLTRKIVIGQPNQKDAFMSAVIDKKAFERISGYIDYAKSSKNLHILTGGICDDSKGYFIEPTIVECTDPNDRIFREEIFGPVLTVYPYQDQDCDNVLNSVRSHTPFALTGAVFANDEAFLAKARQILRESCGNFYINDKCTGSIVGQQPFGGAALSGTNDKAGSPHYLLKWSSPWTTKETSYPLHSWRYPSMD